MQKKTNNNNKIIEKIIQFFKHSSEETKDNVLEGVCPNCWGEQEYDNKIRAMYEDKQIDVNDHTANYAFIQEFVVNHVNGIQLVKEHDRLLCPSCLRKHRKVV